MIKIKKLLLEQMNYNEFLAFKIVGIVIVSMMIFFGSGGLRLHELPLSILIGIVLIEMFVVFSNRNRNYIFHVTVLRIRKFKDSLTKELEAIPCNNRVIIDYVNNVSVFVEKELFTSSIMRNQYINSNVEYKRLVNSFEVSVLDPMFKNGGKDDYLAIVVCGNTNTLMSRLYPTINDHNLIVPVRREKVMDEFLNYTKLTVDDMLFKLR